MACRGIPSARMVTTVRLMTFPTEPVNGATADKEAKLTRLNESMIARFFVLLLQEWEAVEADHLVGDAAAPE